jgi:hypothetical protein
MFGVATSTIDREVIVARRGESVDVSMVPSTDSPTRAEELVVV